MPMRLIWTPTPVRLLRGLVFVLALLPFLRLVLDAVFDLFGGLGANPIEFITRSTGTWTLVMLCLTLTVTPLRRWTGWSPLIRIRRMLGLYAFFYGVMHLLTYLWFDQFFDLAAIARDILKRPFITAGFAAFVLMVPLALTSTDAMIRRLGRRWSLLHRLVYAVAILALLHYAWHKAGKNDFFEVSLYAAVVALLLGARWVSRRATRPSPGT
jgi:sulfoxide reductase heme-binding subunit YedZ